MSVEDVMQEHGFSLSASCAGRAQYTKFVKYNGRRAYISVTDAGGEGFPATLDDPVRVTIIDFRSGDEVESARDIPSLRAYLESLRDD
ncbi:MAG: hypothetical protein AB9866_14240 [Syntrophobacteraceae bacterium]